MASLIAHYLRPTIIAGMDEKPRGSRFQFKLQTLFWLMLAIAVLSLIVPALFGWRPWLAPLTDCSKHGELNEPLILGVVVFFAVRFLIGRDRPGRG